MIVTCQAETNGGNTKAQNNFNYEISCGDSIMIEELHRSEFMADQQIKECQTEFTKAAPEKPWDNQSVAKFEPLINLIETHTQSDMFRRVGQYTGNGDYYDIAHEMDDADKTTDTRTFPNGVTAQVLIIAAYRASANSAPTANITVPTILQAALWKRPEPCRCSSLMAAINNRTRDA
jgi:hypothetical protein